MIQPFRKIRQKLLAEGSLKRYLLYAVGEILLVVIGILLALQINNWNEERKERLIEKEILAGIRNDLLSDTLDMYYVINGYESLVNLNLLLLNNLLYTKKYDPSIGYKLFKRGFDDYTIKLHRSHFEEAKLRGLEIIKNAELRQHINYLYEIAFAALLFHENEFASNDYFGMLASRISPYLEIDMNYLKQDSLLIGRTPATISPESYSKLLLDKELQFLILSFTRKNSSALNEYADIRAGILKVVDEIDKELAER